MGNYYAAEAVLRKVEKQRNTLLSCLSELMRDAPYDHQTGECQCDEFTGYVPLSDEPSVCRHTRAYQAIDDVIRETGGVL